MTSPYSGNPASGARSPAVLINAVVDGDAANGANLSGAEKVLADFVAWLQAHAAVFDDANTFSAAQTFQALVTLLGNLSLNASVLQSILKGGTGKLQVGTSQASDLELVANNIVRLALLSAGGIDAKTQRILNVVNPTAAQDAATKAYSDALGVSAPTVSTIVRRDAAGRAQFVDPAAAADAATKGYADALGTSAPTVSTIARRDAAGRTQFATPSVAADAATKGYADGLGTSAPTASTIARRDASGRSQFADPSATADAATKGYVDAATGGHVRLAADFTTTLNTLQNVTGLSFPVDANSNYEFEVVLFQGNDNNTVGGSRVSFSGPASPTTFHMTYQWASDVGAVSVKDNPSLVGPGATAGTMYLNKHADVVRGYLINGANAGTMQFQAALNSANGTLRIYAGSYLKWRKV